MSPVSRSSKSHAQQSENTLTRVLRAAMAWMSPRRDDTPESKPRLANVKADMPVTREEECLTTHF